MQVEPVSLLIGPESHASIGSNIQGPSLVRVPKTTPNKLGEYYLYFADHKGAYIRLAYADRVEGPWTIHEPGALHLDDSFFLTQQPVVDQATIDRVIGMYRDSLSEDQMPFDVASDLVVPHIASPDVHVEDESGLFTMYFHGLAAFATQRTRVATSVDGLRFEARQPLLIEETYLRVFDHLGVRYGIAMPGQCYRWSEDSESFEQGPLLFESTMRHIGVEVREEVLDVYWTRVGDCPERILRSQIDLQQPFESWIAVGASEVHRPTESWEGANLPLEASRAGCATRAGKPAPRPFVFVDGNDRYLLYAAAGESGIGLARIIN